MSSEKDTLEQRIQRVVQEEVAIATYDPAWPEAFRREKEYLLSCLPNDLVRDRSSVKLASESFDGTQEPRYSMGLSFEDYLTFFHDRKRQAFFIKALSRHL